MIGVNVCTYLRYERIRTELRKLKPYHLWLNNQIENTTEIEHFISSTKSFVALIIKLKLKESSVNLKQILN